MRIVDVVRARKDNVAEGHWSDNALRNRDFPMSLKRKRCYPLSRRYRWSIATFNAQGRRFRLLVAYHTLVPEFVATLAEQLPQDSRILARWEYHGSHRGWHVHTDCGTVDAVRPGLLKGPDTKRMPKRGAFHRHIDLLRPGASMSDSVATAIGLSLCGIPHALDMFAVGALPWD